MKYWKIRFDGEHEATTGWLEFNDQMEALRITNEAGETIVEGRDYTPTQFDTTPEWA
jgi:hypothetical protein